MSVILIEQLGVRHLMIQGERLTLEQEGQLAAQLPMLLEKPLEVRCYDLQWPSAQLVALFGQLMNEGRNKIFCYKLPLFRYLKSLGLPARLVQEQSLPREERDPFRALVIGGSAESLDKIIQLVEGLPLHDWVVLIVQHVSEDRLHLLDRLLQQRTPYSVLMPHHLTPLQAGTIYIAPPGLQMRVAHGLLYLTRDRLLQGARPSLDALFASAGEEFAEAALGVILCGWGEDGVAGGKQFAACGGKLLLLEAEDCPTARSMLLHARQEISQALTLGWESLLSLLWAAALGAEKIVPEQAIDAFYAAVNRQYGYDFRAYHRDMLARRLEITRQALAVDSLYECQREVLTSPLACERLFLELSINVTAFFRMPAQFHFLQQKIFPYLASFPHLKIWIAGCSSGEEVYSLAILLHEAGLFSRCIIYATDINPFVLLQARNGLYAKEQLITLQQYYQEAGGQRDVQEYFVDNSLTYVEIQPFLKEKILFYRHSLAGDGAFNEFQLILCRNLLIYFNQTLQKEVMSLFDRSLHRDGVLLLGEKEGIQQGEGERYFTALKKGTSFYSRRSWMVDGNEG
ncbi:CheR family methyltransferase [Candidatus Magnetaquicoccus inordinatus]|uniref:CheR family methyltransferase n=1 Tax=Candidatus Magnetaquicoccus inordinatus TaxID=2496818 RepID=UPI00102C8BB3|nr:CheR family methyltransferase [Candidatus Magnetaquicoccus inordinatus]